MPTKKTTTRAVSNRAATARAKQHRLLDAHNQAVGDSYTNDPSRIGSFTGNQASAGFYPLTRFTQQYMTLLAMYRSHWIVRKVVDVVAEDMLKHAPILNCDMNPNQIKKFDKALRDTGTMDKLGMALKWGRLFGGGVGVICLEGHDDLSKPLKLDDVDLNSYRGIIPLDRWAGVFPGPKLVSDMNYPNDFGLPEYYTCSMQDGVLNVHHTRIVRFSGRPLPEWERQVELYWGLSEIEVIFDELQKRDYTSWNIVSLVTRAQILAVKDEQLAQSMSGAGKTNAAFTNYLQRMDAMAQSMNNQGLMVVGKEGGIEGHQYGFGGLADIYNAFMADIAGAAEIPMSRLYGRTTSGLGTSGEGDLQIYYDLVESKRTREVNPQMDKLLPIICMSVFGKVPADFDYSWAPVRTMDNKERSELAKSTTESIQGAYEADLITKREARMELRQAADDHGLFSNLDDADIANTPNKYASELGGGELDFPIDKESTNEPTTEKEDRPPKPEPREKPASAKSGNSSKAKAAKDAAAITTERCGKPIWRMCPECDGRIHLPTCKVALHPSRDCCVERGCKYSMLAAGKGTSQHVMGDASAFAEPESRSSVDSMLHYHDIPVTVETPQGATRKGLLWKVNMPTDYGYIDGITGADGDDLDCYVGPSPESDRVFVVDQNKLWGSGFDEHKVMLGYHTQESALEDYMRGHHRSNKVFRAITEMSMPMFRHWMKTGDLTKPVQE